MICSEVVRNTRLRLLFLPTLSSCFSRSLLALQHNTVHFFRASAAPCVLYNITEYSQGFSLCFCLKKILANVSQNFPSIWSWSPIQVRRDRKVKQKMKNMEKRQVLNLKRRSPIEHFMGKNCDIFTPNFLKITVLKHNKSEKLHRECSEQPHEKTHGACTASIPESFIQFLIILL